MDDRIKCRMQVCSMAGCPAAEEASARIAELELQLSGERGQKEIWEARAKEWCDKATALESERDALKMEARSHAQEARTANATIAEIYQVVTGSTGEPGNWNGAESVRQYIATLLHDIEIHAQEAIYAHAKVEAMEKGAEPVAWLVTSKRGLVRCAWTEKPSPDQLATCKFDGDAVTPLYDMPRGYPDTRWISVNDRLPANWGSYLVWDKHEGMRSAWFQLLDGGLDGRKAGLWYSDERRADSDEQDYGITHWMPLPEAPANQKQAG